MQQTRHRSIAGLIKATALCLFALMMTIFMTLSVTFEARAQNIYYAGLRKPLPHRACVVEPYYYFVSGHADTNVWIYDAKKDSWGPYDYEFKAYSDSWLYQTSSMTPTLEHCETSLEEGDNGGVDGGEVCVTLPGVTEIDYYAGDFRTFNVSNSVAGINSPSMSQVLKGSVKHLVDYEGHRVQGVIDEEIKWSLGDCNAPDENCKYYGRANVDSSSYYVNFTPGITGELKINYEVDNPIGALNYYHPHTSRVRLYYYDGISTSQRITLTGTGTFTLPVAENRKGYVWVSGIQASLEYTSNIARQFNSKVTWDLPCKHPGDFTVDAKPAQSAIATIAGRYYLPVAVRANHDNRATPPSVATAGAGQAGPGPTILCGFIGSPNNFFYIYDLAVALQAEYKVGQSTVTTALQKISFDPLLIGCWATGNFMLDITDYVAAGGAANSPLTIKAYVDPDPYARGSDSPVGDGGQYAEWDETNNVDVDVLRSLIMVDTGPVIVDSPTKPSQPVLVSVGLDSGIAAVALEGVQSGGSLAVTSRTEAPPSPPASFGLLDTHYEVNAPDVRFGRASVSFPYSAAEVKDAQVREESLRLLHFEQGKWKDVTTGIDIETNTISGTVESFSPFAIGALDLADCTISIDNDAAFTGRREIQIFSNIANAQQIRMSNNASFAGAEWQFYSPATPWTLDAPGDQLSTESIFVQVDDGIGNTLCDNATLTDAIIYDPLSPTVTVTLPSFVNVAAGGATRPLALVATDQEGGSGVAEMQISSNSSFSGASWQPFTATAHVESTPPRMIYVRVRDGAGNISNSATVQLSEAGDDEDRSLFLPFVKP